MPLHFHLSEQTAEYEECLAATALTPTGLMRRAGALGPNSTAVHATHLSGDDVSQLGTLGVAVCLCPTTERDLGDGIGPARALSSAGARLCLGSDSHAVIDVFEEARAVELDQRLLTGRRGGHAPDELLVAASSGGMQALHWDAGQLTVGRLADFISVSLDSSRFADADSRSLLSYVVYAASAADVRDVYIGGIQVVADGHHLRLGNVR